MKLEELAPAVVVFILLGILIGVGLTVFAGLGDAARTPTTVTHETFNASLSGTYVTLGNTNIDRASAVFYNATDGTTYSRGYFLFDNPQGSTRYESSTVTLTNTASLAGLNDTNVNVSYTYGATSDATTAITGTSNATDDFVDWFAIIIVVIAASIVIVIVTRSFAGR